MYTHNSSLYTYIPFMFAIHVHGFQSSEVNFAPLSPLSKHQIASESQFCFYVNKDSWNKLKNHCFCPNCSNRCASISWDAFRHLDFIWVSHERWVKLRRLRTWGQSDDVRSHSDLMREHMHNSIGSSFCSSSLLSTVWIIDGNRVSNSQNYVSSEEIKRGTEWNEKQLLGFPLNHFWHRSLHCHSHIHYAGPSKFSQVTLTNILDSGINTFT